MVKSELHEEALALMSELEAEGFNGSSDDANPDKRIVRISEIITLMEVFEPQQLEELINSKSAK